MLSFWRHGVVPTEMDLNSSLNAITGIAKNPWVTGVVGLAVGCTLRPYFTKFFEELGKGHAARLTGSREQRDAERHRREMEEEGLDMLENELRVLVHELEDSGLADHHFLPEYLSALRRIERFFQPHSAIRALAENRSFLNTYCAVNFLQRVQSLQISNDELDRSIAAAKQLRIRKHRPIGEIN